LPVCRAKSTAQLTAGQSTDLLSDRRLDDLFISSLPFSPRGSSKIEEACEIYARAANMFKMAKNWSGACPQPTGLALRVALKSPLHPQDATA
jgi:hypothetical protein